jgi:hypothetical protein
MREEKMREKSTKKITMRMVNQKERINEKYDKNKQKK